MARYLHLNPVRVPRLKVDKATRAAAHVGLGSGPVPELVSERLRTPRGYHWSSYAGDAD